MVRGPDHPAPAPLTRTAAEPAPGPSANRLRALLAPGRRRTTLLFRAATFAGLVIVYGASTWLPTLMVDSGYDLSSSLEFSIAFNVGAVLGTLAAAVVADRGFLKAATVTSFLCAAVAMITLSTPQPRPVLLLASAVAGCGALGTQALVDIYVAHAHPARLRGTALGFSLGVGRIGAIVGPSYLAAVAVLVAAPQAGLYAFVVPAVLGAVLIGLLRPGTRGGQAARSDAPNSEAAPTPGRSSGSGPVAPNGGGVRRQASAARAIFSFRARWRSTAAETVAGSRVRKAATRPVWASPRRWCSAGSRSSRPKPIRMYRSPARHSVVSTRMSQVVAAGASRARWKAWWSS